MPGHNRGPRLRKWERGRIIDRSGYVASGFEAGTEVVITGLVCDAFGPIPTGRALAAPQRRNDDKPTVEKPPDSLGRAVSGYSRFVVGGCAMRDDPTRARV